MTLASGMKQTIQAGREKSRCTSDDSGANTVTGKYGTATITEVDNNGTMKCGIKFTFKSSGVSDRVVGKVIDFDVGEMGIVAREATTTVDDKLLPTAVK